MKPAMAGPVTAAVWKKVEFPGDGVLEDFLGDEEGEERASGGPAEGEAGAEGQDIEVDQSDGGVFMGNECEEEGAEHGAEAGGDNEFTAVEAVGEDTGGEGEEDEGDDLDSGDIAEGDFLFGGGRRLPTPGRWRS